MTKLLFCGDPHGEFFQVAEAFEQHRPDAVILLGDMDLQRDLKVELDEFGPEISEKTWWIPGNHDTDLEANFDGLFGSELADRNLHGRVVDICGIKVAGLGGVFRTKVWDGITDENFSAKQWLAKAGKGNRWRDNGLPLRHRSTIFPADVLGLGRHRADVLVTHEAPGGPGYHELGNPAIARLGAAMGVKRAFHGHHHQDIEYPDGVWRGVGIRNVFVLEI